MCIYQCSKYQCNIKTYINLLNNLVNINIAYINKKLFEVFKEFEEYKEALTTKTWVTPRGLFFEGVKCLFIRHVLNGTTENWVPNFTISDEHAQLPSPPEWSFPTRSFPDRRPFCSGKNQTSGPDTLMEHSSLCWQHNYYPWWSRLVLKENLQRTTL